MVFSDIRFLLFFFIISLFFCFGTQFYKKIVILIVSYVFYSFWSWKFLSLIIISTLIDFIVGKYLDRIQTEKYRKLLLACSVVQNLGLLCFFKYYNFFVESFAEMLGTIGMAPQSLYTLNIILPVGISFYTFQTMSYALDIYRHQIKPVDSVLDFANYVAFFPQLVAGPIERASHLLPQIEKFNGYTLRYWKEALGLIFMGYVRKVLIADNLAPYVDSCFSNYATLGSLELLTGLIFFSLQIYFDFSGYSDIARGIARLYGIDLMINFKQPYFACNMSDFWKRWHISLSTWLRDYLYIPLGGNRKGEFRTHINLMLTMLLGGLWHGSSWNFVIWGGLHGAYLMIYKSFSHLNIPFRGSRCFTLFSIVLVYIAVLLAWLPFRAVDFHTTMHYLSGIINWHGGFPLNAVFLLLLMFCSVLVIDLPIYKSGDVAYLIKAVPLWISLPLVFIICIVILGFMIANMNSARPFIYFQF